MPRRGSAPPLLRSPRRASRLGAFAPAPLALPSPMTTTTALAPGSALRAIAGRSPLPGARDHRALTDGADDDDRVPVNPTPSLRDFVTAAPPRARLHRVLSRSIASADARRALMPPSYAALTIPPCVSSQLHSRRPCRSVNCADHDREPVPVLDPAAPDTVAFPARLPGQLPHSVLSASFFRLGPDPFLLPPQVPTLRRSRFGCHT